MRKLVLKTPPYLYSITVTVLILYLTLVPNPLPDDTPAMFPHADKIVHAVMFWAFYTSFAIDRMRQQIKDGLSSRLSRKWLATIMTTTITFGLAIEIAQFAMGLGRGCDMLDFVADVVGAVVASYTFRPIRHSILRR